MPWSGDLAPMSLVTDERENEPVAVEAENAEPARLHVPIASNSCVTLIVYLCFRASAVAMEMLSKKSARPATSLSKHVNGRPAEWLAVRHMRYTRAAAV